MEWGGIKNGALLKLIEREGFEVFLTGDKNMENQQRLDRRPFAVLIMSAINLPVIGPYVHKIYEAIDGARPGTVKTIDCGVFIARLKRTSGELAKDVDHLDSSFRRAFSFRIVLSNS
jgi:hypothetical protein